MNKTVNINLGGFFFHIDEDAYQKLNRYFDAIRRSLSNSTGCEEIMKDIEMRIAELISEKHASDKQVINSREIDEIIAVMGQPEDYRIEDEPQTTATAYVRKSKKLYRDTDKGMLGGVCSGLGHYFGVDVVWFRVLFLVLLFGFGTGILAYLILWIAIPAAVTTAEKLEMTGEPVTISNIERKVREEFDNVANRFRTGEYSQMGNYAKTGAGRFAAALGRVLEGIFKALGKVIAVLMILFSAGFLIVLMVSVFTIGTTSFADAPWGDFVNAVNYNDTPLWLIALLILLAFGLPLIALFMLGIKLLAPRSRTFGKVARYTMFAIWLIAVATLVVMSVKTWSEVAQDAKTVKKETLAIAAGDTLKVKFRYNDFYDKSVSETNEYRLTQDEKGQPVVYSNDVSLEVLYTDEAQPYIQVVRSAKGKSLSDAKARAERISYNYNFEGNTLVLDNYLITSTENKYRGQEVEILLFLPKGTLFLPDDSVKHFDDSDDAFFNLHYSGRYTYRIDDHKATCLDCPANENEHGDVVKGADTTTISDGQGSTIILDENGILVRKKEGSRTEEINIGKAKVTIEKQ